MARRRKMSSRQRRAMFARMKRKRTTTTSTRRPTQNILSFLIPLFGIAVALSIIRGFRSSTTNTRKRVTTLKGGFVRTETKMIGKQKPTRFRFRTVNPTTKVRLGFVPKGRPGRRDDVVTEVTIFRKR